MKKILPFPSYRVTIMYPKTHAPAGTYDSFFHISLPRIWQRSFFKAKKKQKFP